MYAPNKKGLSVDGKMKTSVLIRWVRLIKRIECSTSNSCCQNGERSGVHFNLEQNQTVRVAALRIQQVAWVSKNSLGRSDP